MIPTIVAGVFGELRRIRLTLPAVGVGLTKEVSSIVVETPGESKVGEAVFRGPTIGELAPRSVSPPTVRMVMIKPELIKNVVVFVFIVVGACE
jgi:hypothetical protein